LSTPMPVGSKMEELFKRYIVLKGCACLGYGICAGVLLHVLSVDMAPAFGVAAFLLSFVPEVGAIVAMLLPAPVILFDSRLEAPFFTLFVATSAQLGLKFVFANVVEVKLVEADQLMKMHPVIILLAVSFFGFIWGPTGMLLSVPLVAYLKVALLRDTVPSCYRDPILITLEGDRLAPAKYARKRALILPGPGRGPEAEAEEAVAGGAPEATPGDVRLDSARGGAGLALWGDACAEPTALESPRGALAAAAEDGWPSTPPPQEWQASPLELLDAAAAGARSCPSDGEAASTSSASESRSRARASPLRPAAMGSEI